MIGEAIEVTAGILQWCKFGAPGDPLPPGLVFKKTDVDGQYKVVYDPAYSIDRGCIGVALAQLENTLPMDTINSLIDRRFDHGLMEEYVSEIITNSESYRLVKMFENDISTKVRSNPLGSFWRTIREQQITQDVRRQYGVLPDEHVIPRSEVDYQIRREFVRLDDEVESGRHNADQETDPLAKAKKYFQSLITEEVEKSGELVTGYGHDSDGDKRLFTNKEPEGYMIDWSDDWSHNAARRLAYSLGERTPLTRFVAKEWLFDLMEKVAWAEPNETLGDIIKSSMVSSVDYLRDLSGEARTMDVDDYDANENEFHVALLAPEGTPRDVQSKFVSCRHDRFRYKRDQSMAEITQLRSRRLGEVLHVSPYGRGANAYRIIQSVAYSEGVSTAAEHEELSMMLYGNGLAGADPYIPGFRLVSRKGRRYGFVLDEAGDPYVSADVPLPDNGRLVLAERYRELGLDKLAKKIQKERRLTVQGLTSMIQETSIYAETEDVKRYDLPGSLSIDKIQDLQPLVRKSRLYLQCTGAAKALKVSLEEVFGQGCATAIDGIMLSRRSIDEASMHQQIVFSDGEQTFVLDATPASERRAPPKDLLFPKKNVRKSLFAVSMRAQKYHPAPPEPTAETFQEWPKSEENDNVRTKKALEIYLQGVMGVSDKEALYERVVALPLDDPLRRTVEAVLRVTSDDMGQEELDSVRYYLNLYEKTDEALRRQMKVASYEKSIIDFLKTMIERLRVDG